MLSKIFKYSRRFIPYKLKKIVAFFRDKLFNIFSVVIIETSSVCNRRCLYCPNSMFERGLIKNNKKLEAELFYNVIDQLADLKWFGQIQFNFYNEPLLDERLPEFIKYASSKLTASSFVIYTNGDYLTQNLYCTLKESGVTDFIITEHDNSGLDSVLNLTRFRKLKNSDRVNVVIRKLDRFYSRGGLVKLSTGERKLKHCLWGVHSFIINHEGEAVLCCEDYFNTVKLGNVGDEKILDIWNKPSYRQIRRELKKGVFKYNICRKCATGSFDKQI